MYGYSRKNKNKKRNIIIVVASIILVVLLLAYSLKSNRTTTIVERGLKDTSMFITKVVMFPFTSLNKQKNVDQSKSYIIQKNVNSSLEKEIEELKQELKLNKTLTEYDIENATVLTRNKSYFFNTITIDKGSKSGIKKDMTVVTYNGLIGKINKVTYNSSEVKLITSDDLNYKVSVSITTKTKDYYAILSGYNKKNNTVKVTGVEKNSDINKGDVVLTSGLGGVFPRGIYVGVVDDIKSDKYDLSKTLYVKTKEDFNSIHYVTVLKEKK